MPIRLEIVTDTFSQMISELGGAVRLFVAPPQGQAEAQPDAPVANTGEQIVDAEVIEPTRKPNSRKRQPQTIEATANPPAVETKSEPPKADPDLEEAPATDTVKTYELEGPNGVRAAVIAYVNEIAKKTPDNKDAKADAFIALKKKFDFPDLKSLPVEKYPAVMEFVTAPVA